MRGFLLPLCALMAGCQPSPMEGAKDIVRTKMLDPGSTKFRDVEACGENKEMVAGDVNGKNAAGVYTGFKSFIVDEAGVSFEGDVQFRSYMTRCYGKTFMDELEKASRTIDRETGSEVR